MRSQALFKIAFKSLLGKKLRSTLTVGGVMVGIAAIVFLVSLAYGIQNLIIEQATGLEALKIVDIASVNNKVLKLDSNSMGQLKAIPHVSKVEPLVNIPGQLSFAGSSTDIVSFGASAEYVRLAEIALKYGDIFNDNDNGIIVNTTILKLVGVAEEDYESSLGKEATISLVVSQEMLADGEETKVVEETLRIVGVVEDSENPYIFLPVRILENNGVVNYSQAKAQVDAKENVANARQIIESIGFKTNSVADTVAQIDQVFTIFRVILASFGAIALIVAALGMFNTLTVSLLERTREVGLMKALGARRREVFSLFLIESLLISGMGGSLGIALGFGLGQIFNYVINRLAQATGNDMVVIFSTPYVFVIGIFVFALVVGFLTGIYPSQRAGRINPLDALRYE